MTATKTEIEDAINFMQKSVKEAKICFLRRFLKKQKVDYGFEAWTQVKGSLHWLMDEFFLFILKVTK